MSGLQPLTPHDLRFTAWLRRMGGTVHLWNLVGVGFFITLALDFGVDILIGLTV